MGGHATGSSSGRAVACGGAGGGGGGGYANCIGAATPACTGGGLRTGGGAGRGGGGRAVDTFGRAIAAGAGGLSSAGFASVVLATAGVGCWFALSSAMLVFNCSICWPMAARSRAIDWINSADSQGRPGAAAGPAASPGWGALAGAPG